MAKLSGNLFSSIFQVVSTLRSLRLKSRQFFFWAIPDLIPLVVDEIYGEIQIKKEKAKVEFF